MSITTKDEVIRAIRLFIGRPDDVIAVVKNRVTPGAVTHSLEKTAEASSRLKSGGFLQSRDTKKAVNLVLRQQFEAVIEAHLGLELMSHFTDDHAEAVQAFFDKRPPVFRGC